DESDINATARKAVDRVYYDAAGGEALATHGWVAAACPLGLHDHPINNLADALAIMGAYGYTRMELMGACPLNFTVDAELELVGNRLSNITVGAGVTVDFTGDVLCNQISNAGTITSKDIVAVGDIDNTGGILTVNGNLTGSSRIITTAGAAICQITVSGNCNIADDIEFLATGAGFFNILGNGYFGEEFIFDTGTTLYMTVHGDLNVPFREISWSSTNRLLVGGNVYCYQMGNYQSGDIWIYGNCNSAYEDVTIYASGGDIKIFGDCRSPQGIRNASNAGGTLDIYGNCDCSYGAIEVNAAGNICIWGNAKARISTGNASTGDLEVDGNLQSIDVLHRGTGTILVEQKLEGRSIRNQSTGTITVEGSCDVASIASAAGGTISLGKTTVSGNVTNPGTLTVASLVSGGIVGNTGGNLTVNGNFQSAGNLTNTTGIVDIAGNAFIGDSISTTTGNVGIGGSLFVWGSLSSTNTGDYSVTGYAEVGSIANSGGGTVSFFNGLKCRGGFDNTGGGAIGITGPSFITGTLTLSGATNAIIYGDLQVNELQMGSSGTITLLGSLTVNANVVNDSAGTITISGTLYVGTTLSNNNAGSSITVSGEAKINGAITNIGTLIYRGMQRSSVGSTTANWQSGVATSGETGGDLCTIGANDDIALVHSAIVSIHNLIGAITVKLFQQVNGTERKVYEQAFTAGVDPDGLWIINGTLSIHEALRIEVESDNAADNAKAIDYDYQTERK
ncbi:MAG: hypothetical protein PHI12_11265, partial [Dehalococcoidales bacterium]|nr:hypothetical protein [Dehalococcoidales bacterium]